MKYNINPIGNQRSKLFAHFPPKKPKSCIVYLIPMNLSLNSTLASPYKSKSQIARILTEAWFKDNMYCPACPSNTLKPLPANTKVLDFQCPKCEETYQVKSKSGKFYNTIVNSEYQTKIEKIKKGLSPNWALLQYDAQVYEVTDLVIIPRHFMTLEAVKARNPLKKTARRDLLHKPLLI